MIKIIKITSLDKSSKLRREYIENLIEPIDGYWETVTIGFSQCYEIEMDEEIVGHCTIKKDKRLVQFCVYKDYFTNASEILKHLINEGIVESAGVSTKEPEFLAVCLDHQKKVHVDGYLFSDTEKGYEFDEKLKAINFRLAVDNDIKEIKDKCDIAFDGYYEGLIQKDQLFVLYNGDDLMGIGEFRRIKTHDSYGDIGMIVAEKHRRKGVGTYIINRLREHCHKNNLKALASCDVNNIASRKTLEKAGLTANHRIIYIDFK